MQSIVYKLVSMVHVWVSKKTTVLHHFISLAGSKMPIRNFETGGYRYLGRDMFENAVEHCLLPAGSSNWDMLQPAIAAMFKVCWDT